MAHALAVLVLAVCWLAVLAVCWLAVCWLASRVPAHTTHSVVSAHYPG